MLKNIVASVPNVLISLTFVLPTLFLADSASGAPLSTRALNQQQTAALNLHNQARAEVFTSNELQWDSTLEQHAKEWVEELAKRGTDINQNSHAKGTGEGENLWMTKSSAPMDAPPLGSAVRSWLTEKADYHGEAIPNLDSEANRAFFSSIGHYTQVVWKKTTKVGMAKAKSADGKKWFIVARYSPPGNFIGQKPY